MKRMFVSTLYNGGEFKRVYGADDARSILEHNKTLVTQQQLYDELNREYDDFVGDGEINDDNRSYCMRFKVITSMFLQKGAKCSEVYKSVADEMVVYYCLR